MTKKITKEVANALEWAAAEFSYLRTFHQSLEKIESEDISEQEKELKKDRKVVRYATKAEARVERDVKDVLTELKEGKKVKISSTDLSNVIKELEIPANKLVGEGSRYVGTLRKQLKSIRTDVAIAKKYPDNTSREKVREEIKKLEGKVIDLEKWIAALDVALKKAAIILSKEETLPEIVNRILAEYIQRLTEMGFLKDGKIALRDSSHRTSPKLMSPDKIKSLKTINEEILNNLSNIHIILIVLGDERNEEWGEKVQRDKKLMNEIEKLKDKLLHAIKVTGTKEEISTIREFIKKLGWQSRTLLRRKLPVEKLRRNLIKLIKVRKIPFEVIEEIPGEEFIKEKWGYVMHGLSRRTLKRYIDSNKDQSPPFYTAAIDILNEGFANDFQCDGAINLNVVFHKSDPWEIFKWFNPFGFILKKEVNQILSSPIVPQGYIDEKGILNTDCNFGYHGIRRQHGYHKIEIRKHMKRFGISSKSTMAWQYAESNANVFKTVFSVKYRGNYGKLIRDHPDIEEEYFGSYDADFGFRGFYVGDDKKVHGLKVTPQMIEKLIIYLPDIKSEFNREHFMTSRDFKEYLTFLEELTGKRYE